MQLRSEARCAALAVALIVAVLTPPGALFATSSAPEQVAGANGFEREHARLAAVRERVVRRAAMHRALGAQVEELAERIEALRVRREESEDALQRVRDQEGELERRLDWVVPRLAARARTVDMRREQAANALADLAGLSRQVELDPATRARLLAVSPLMLERLRSADASLAGLRAEGERVAAAYRSIGERAPALLAERQKLERERLGAQRRREAQIEEIGRIEAELAALRREEQVLAQQLIAVESAVALRAEPQPEDPALRSHVAVAGAAEPPHRKAAVKGVALRPNALAEAVNALRPAPSQVVVAALRPAERSPVEELRSGAPPPPPAKPIGAVSKADVDGGTVARDRASLGRSAAIDVALLEPGVGGGQLLALSPARIARPDAPIMPIPGQVVTGFGDGSGGREKAAISIAAAPGQAVAAPADGRVVFAGTFRSYGLLLILEHEREYHTLLWGFSRLDVGLGKDVRTGQVVGVMGVDGGQGPELHVELRQHGRPVNPLPWLAASSSKVRG